MYWNIYNGQRKRKQMTDLTKIEKPYVFCTKEEQEGLDALANIPNALQRIISTGEWEIPHTKMPRRLYRGVVYRQNPDWQPPTLDVPDWFWETTGYDYVAIDQSGPVYAYKHKPKKVDISWNEAVIGLVRLDVLFQYHNFNPHNVPWDKSLTVRPGLEE